MNDCRSLHETVFGQIINTLYDKATEEAKRAPSNKSAFSSSSLAKMTSNLILVFPVMVSRQLSIKTAQMIAKAIEMRGVQMVQMVFAANQITDDNIEDLFAYLSRFHKNINIGDPLNFSVDDFIDAVNKFSEAKISPEDEKMLKAIREDMGNLEFYFENNISVPPLSSYSVKRKVGGYEIYSEGYSRIDPSIYASTTSLDHGDVRGYAKNYIDAQKYNMSVDKANQAAEKHQYDIEKLQAGANKDALSFKKDFAPTLLDTDVKKANETLPTLLKVNFYVKNPGGTATKIEGAIIGIKSRIVPVESADIINQLTSKAQNSNILLNFIKATTRETSFAKDFLFGINKAKIDAMAASKKSTSPMWRVLEQRAKNSKRKRYLNNNNAYMAITTLVVSQEEADLIKANSNGMYDYEDYKMVNKLIDNLNILCFCIVDESLEIVKMYFDSGDNTWDNYPFTALQRENNNDDYKKIINLMTKIAK